MFIVIRDQGLGFSDLDGAATDVEGAAGVAGYGCDFPAGELDGVGVDDVVGDVLEAGADDFLELIVRVAWEEDAREAEPAADFVAEGALGEIHGVGYGEDDEPTVAQTGPVKEVVHDGLVLCDELV